MKRARVTEELAYGTALDRLTGANEVVTEAEKRGPIRQPVEQPKTAMIKLSVFLGHEEDAYLEALASTAKFTGGKKLSKTKIIESMVRGFKATELDVRGVKTEEELRRRVIAQLR